jgi:hypothetical protein
MTAVTVVFDGRAACVSSAEPPAHPAEAQTTRPAEMTPTTKRSFMAKEDYRADHSAARARDHTGLRIEIRRLGQCAECQPSERFQRATDDTIRRMTFQSASGTRNPETRNGPIATLRVFCAHLLYER